MAGGAFAFALALALALALATSLLGAVVPGASASGRADVPPAGANDWKCRTTAASVRGIEIASFSPLAVLNSTT